MKTHTPLADLLRVSQHRGRIPAEVPGHYVAWALAEHRKNQARPARSWRHLPATVIIL